MLYDVYPCYAYHTRMTIDWRGANVKRGRLEVKALGFSGTPPQQRYIVELFDEKSRYAFEPLNFAVILTNPEKPGRLIIRGTQQAGSSSPKSKRYWYEFQQWICVPVVD